MENKKLLIRLFSVFIVIIIVLGAFLIYNEWPFIAGQTIILETQPVDPFDPFRGQYMDIRYEISRLEVTGYESGDKICVLLEKDGEGIHRMKEISHSGFDMDPFICGRVARVSGNSVRVEYGIEQYFFERGASFSFGRNSTVEAVVTNSGRAGIVQLLSNGDPVEIKYRDVTWKS